LCTYYYYYLPCGIDQIFFLPVNNEITNRIKKIKNKILAILAAPAAIPPNPKIAAIIANITNVTVTRSMRYVLLG
jgi:hypothetical protein